MGFNSKTVLSLTSNHDKNDFHTNDLIPPNPTKTISLDFWPSVPPKARISPPRKHRQNRAFAATLRGNRRPEIQRNSFHGVRRDEIVRMKVVYHGLRSGKARFLSWNLFFYRTSFYSIPCSLMSTAIKPSSSANEQGWGYLRYADFCTKPQPECTPLPYHGVFRVPR